MIERLLVELAAGAGILNLASGLTMDIGMQLFHFFPGAIDSLKLLLKLFEGVRGRGGACFKPQQEGF